MESLEAKLRRVKGESEAAKLSQQAMKTEYENYKVQLLLCILFVLSDKIYFLLSVRALFCTVYPLNIVRILRYLLL